MKDKSNYYKYINYNWLNKYKNKNNSNFYIIQKKIYKIIKLIIKSKNYDIKNIYKFNNYNYNYIYKTINNIKKLYSSYRNKDNLDFLQILLNQFNNYTIYELLFKLNLYGINIFFNLNVIKNYYDNSYIFQYYNVFDIYNKKNINLIFKLYQLYYTISIEELQELNKINKKLYKLYNNIDSDHKKCKLSKVNTKYFKINKYIKYINNYFKYKIISENDDIIYENYDKEYINYINKLFKNKILLKKFLIFKFFEYIVDVYLNIDNIYEYVYIVYNNFISSIYKSELYKTKLTKKVYKDIKDIYNNLIETYTLEINNHTNIQDEQKKYILNKLNNIKIEIGFPTHNIKYYYKINNSFLQNYLNINKYIFIKNYLLISKSVSNKYWEISPIDVNACYINVNNKIIIPDAILYDPFYNYKENKIVKYAKIGSIIAHEISHSIDINNLNYDYKGILQKNLDIHIFDKEISKLEKQFKKNDKFYKQKTGENIADLYGISISLLSINRIYKIDQHNLNNEDIKIYKKFFKNYSIMWRSSYNINKKKFLLNYDVHSLAEHRVNIILKNINVFRKINKYYKNKNNINIFNI